MVDFQHVFDSKSSIHSDLRETNMGNLFESVDIFGNYLLEIKLMLH